METIAARAGTTKPTSTPVFVEGGCVAATVTREYELRDDRLFEAYASGAEDLFGVRLARWNAAYFDLVGERPDGFKLISDGERHPAGRRSSNAPLGRSSTASRSS